MTLLTIFLVSVVVGLCAALLVMRGAWGQHFAVSFSGDPQHVHDGMIPRAGGIALGVSALAGAAVAHGTLVGTFYLVSAILLSAVPILAVGLAEDIAGRVPPRWRYFASLLSAALAYQFAGAQLGRMDVEVFDAALTWQPLVFVVSMFCIAGVAQAFNIVDGKNGLSAGIALIALLLFVLASVDLNDRALATVSAIGAGGALGILVLNYPRGLVFLGDGGAYFLGFLIAVIAVVLVGRHDGISAWYPLLLAAYPILETLASFFRRLLIERQGFHQPDHLHLHSLLYRALFLKLRRRFRPAPWQINSLCSLPILIASLAVALLAHHWRQETAQLQTLAVVVVLFYLLAYVALRLTRARYRGRRTTRRLPS